MKYLILIAALSCISMVSCNDSKPNVSSQFVFDQQDGKLHCPKCGSSFIKSLDYDSGNDNGSGDVEHFNTFCGQCGFHGWSSLQDGKSAIQAQSNKQ